MVHERTKQFLTSRLSRMGELQTRWESKYEIEFEEKSKELEELTERRDQDRERLDNLRMQRKNQKEDFKARTIAEKKQAAELKQKKLAQAQQYKAACKIRFFWKVFWNKESKGASKGGKKKKKGKD